MSIFSFLYGIFKRIFLVSLIICFLHKKSSFQAAVVEMTWVVSDHVAPAGSQELSVCKGQQVEVVEVCASRPDFCLVRMPTQGHGDHDGAPEGLVPLAVLKQPPAQRSSPSRRPNTDHDAGKSSYFL